MVSLGSQVFKMRVTLTIVDMENSLRRLNQNSVDFMLTGVDLAGTFLDIAETTHSDETMRRNHVNARKAYDTGSALDGKARL